MKCLFRSFAHFSIGLPVFFLLVYRKLFIYCYNTTIYVLQIISPLKAFDVHTFSDIPKVNLCGSVRILYCALHKDLLFFVSSVDIGASFCQYSFTKAMLGYWSCRVTQGLLKFLAYLGAGIFWGSHKYKSY